MALSRKMRISRSGAKQMAESCRSVIDVLNRSVYDASKTEPDVVFRAYREAASKAAVVLITDVLSPIFAKYPELEPDELK